jgi:hypothetical protein
MGEGEVRAVPGRGKNKHTWAHVMDPRSSNRAAALPPRVGRILPSQAETCALEAVQTTSTFYRYPSEHLQEDLK